MGKVVKIPARTVFDKTVGEKRLKIEVDRHNWNVYYGTDGKSFGNQPSHFSNMVSMVRWLDKAVIKALTQELNPLHIQRIVTESEGYLVDMAKDIKQMFHDSPFLTPERRHEEQAAANGERS